MRDEAVLSELEYERCVLCGTYTKVLSRLPVECRREYVYGCGQLCEKCFVNLNVEGKGADIFPCGNNEH